MEEQEEVLREIDSEVMLFCILKQNIELIFGKMVFLVQFFYEYFVCLQIRYYRFNRWHPAVGIGLRIKWKKQQ